MSAANIFQLHLVSGYVVWALCFGVYVVPWLRSMERAAAFRALAALALAAFRVRPVFLALFVAFNAVGAADLIVDYYHAIQADLPARAGQLGAMYAIPVLYVPALMISHLLAFNWLLVQRRERPASLVAGGA